MKFHLWALSTVFIFTSACTHVSKPEKSALSVLPDQPVPYPPNERIPAEAVNPNEIDWWAANEAQVKGALCRSKLPITTKEIEAFYKATPSASTHDKGDYEIGGFTLKNERPHLVLALSKLISPVSEYNTPRRSIENFQEKLKINPSCDKALCAAKKIFGPDVGPQMLYLMDQFDVNTSPYSYANASFFTPSEIADVIRTFELIKADQLPFPSNKKLIRFMRGYTRASYADGAGQVVANAAIELFDKWSTQNSILRQYTIYHEIAHNHSDNQFSDYDRSGAWLALSNWKESENGQFEAERAKAQQGHPFVSRYGKTNPFEDFAESVTAYRFNPDLLKRQSMDKYNFIKYLVHDGLEFTSQADCRRQPLSQKYQERIQREGEGLSPSEQEAVLKACRQPFYQLILGNVPLNFFESCVNYEATVHWYKKYEQHNTELLPQALFDHKLRISALKFPELQKTLIQKLQPEVTDWILSSLNIITYNLRSDMSNVEYCEQWSRLENKVYPAIDRSSKWYDKGIFLSREFSPKAGAGRALCLKLVDGFQPSASSPATTIRETLSMITQTGNSAVLQERGINHETILKYVVDRSSPRRR